MKRLVLPWVAVGLAVLLLSSASVSSAADFTWSGLGSDFNWSSTANWQGGVAPTSGVAIGTLTFPEQLDPACVFPACINSVNDLDGVSIDHLNVTGSLSDLSGNGISLGSGGLSASPGGSIYLRLPIGLTASQTWNVSDGDGFLILEGLLDGASDLTVNGGFWLTSDGEVGDVTLNNGGLVLIGDPGTTASLNASNGHGVTLNGGGLTAADAAVGALHSVGASILIGDPFDNSTSAGRLAATSASFDAASSLALSVTGTGTTAGTDYGQLTSTGNVALGGSTLHLATVSQDQCADLPIGQSYTLVSTTGSLSGSFGNAPEGTAIADEGSCEATSYRINYHETGSTQIVTATVLTSNTGALPVNTVLPQTEGDPVVGATLIGDTGTWMGDKPQTYTLQWLRDGVPFGDAITGTNLVHSYVVQDSDRGHTVALRVIAHNSSGNTTATSVSLSVPGAGSGSTGGGGSGSVGSGGTLPGSGAPQLPPGLQAGVAALGKIQVHGTTIVLGVVCSQGGGCPKLSAQLSVVEHLRRGKLVAIGAATKRTTTRRVVVGSSTISLRAGQHKQLMVRLNRIGQILLKRFKHVSSTLKLTSGRSRIGSKRVRLRWR